MATDPTVDHPGAGEPWLPGSEIVQPNTTIGRLSRLDAIFSEMEDQREKRAALHWLKQRYDP